MSRRKRPGKPARRAASAAPRRWPRRLLAFGAGLALGVVVPWVAWLDHHASTRFAERQWTQAGRVYARPLELYPGRPLAPADLEIELGASGLVDVAPIQPGRYRREGSRFTLALPEARFADGVQPARTVRLSIRNGRVADLVDGSGRGVDLVRLPAAELGSLLPLDDRDRTLLPIAEFPPLLITGIQAVEDRQFGRHHGVDPRAVMRALIRNLRSGDIVQGGSTITQQLVKNLFLGSEKNLLRKINEAVMAVSLEMRFEKADILEAYLNEVYLGQNGAQAIHGFGRAAEHYFGLPVASLSSDQVALLVGMVRGASWYHPVRNPERARARRDLVLGMFHETGLIDEQEHRRAIARPLGVEAPDRAARRAHPAFLDMVRRQLRADYRDSDLRERGLRIYTTLSPSAQAHAERALSEGLSGIESEAGTLQGAIVLARPETGEIRALVGDRDPRRAGFNRALDARRPVGSIIKPFVYLLALADPARFTLVTPVEDAPINVPQRGREDWTPRNHDGESHGTVPLMTALARSYNQATVRVGLAVGVDALFRLLEHLGVAPGSERHPAAFLGAVDLTPLQVTQLYQPLAASGYSTPLRAITDVVDRRGESIARYPMRLRSIRERDALALMDFALEEAVRNGTGRGLSALLTEPARGLPIRGKTGTTNDRRDAWFAGFTERWLGVVWVGRDDNLPAGIGGASAAMPVWARLFGKLPVEAVGRDWPDSIEWFWIDWPHPRLADRDCPGARAIPFARNSRPEARSTCMRR
ncbi:MAG: penicillin-binding protein 1B [Wenzhouxiangellaceae bacterium]|nr:penicillin-binding protein 1B [Wenzhouxiangellaceae bacterium]